MCRFIRLCVFLWTSNRVWLVRIHLSVCVCMSVCIPPSHPPDPRCKCASADKEPAGIQRSANTVCTTLNTHTGNCRFTAGQNVCTLQETVCNAMNTEHCIICCTLYVYCRANFILNKMHANTVCSTLNTEHCSEDSDCTQYTTYCRTNSAHRTECTPSEHHVQHTKHTYCMYTLLHTEYILEEKLHILHSALSPPCAAHWT